MRAHFGIAHFTDIVFLCMLEVIPSCRLYGRRAHAASGSVRRRRGLAPVIIRLLFTLIPWPRSSALLTVVCIGDRRASKPRYNRRGMYYSILLTVC